MLSFGLHSRRESAAGDCQSLRAVISLVLAVSVAACLLAAGCSTDKERVQDVAMTFVESMKKQDPDLLESVMDWERYYEETGAIEDGMNEEAKQEKIKKESEIFKQVLAMDRGLAILYLTAEHEVKRVKVSGVEAEVEIAQEDRATHEKRKLVLWLHKDDRGDWKIYKFSTLEADQRVD